MPYLQLDIPNRYPLDLKRDLARRLGETFAHIVQTTPDLVTVAFRELGEGECGRVALAAPNRQRCSHATYGVVGRASNGPNWPKR
jgi:phenylpyruvate tautomerase PptA (4-oxalocrotonate tautomerase family)